MKLSTIELNLDDISDVSGGHIRDNLSFGREESYISNDATYGAGIAGAIFFTGVLLVPGIGAAVALTAFSASLISSGVAISAGTK